MKTQMIQKSENQLSVFAQTYETLTGFKVDWKYLQNAKVRAFYSNDGQILGGYAISSTDQNPYFRYLEFIGIEQDEILAEKGIQKSDLSEITYTFLTNFAQRPQRILILSMSVFDALMAGKKYVLGGGIVRSFNERMKPVLKKVLFEGEVPVGGRTRRFTVLFEKKEYLLGNLIKAVIQEFLKLFSKQKHLKKGSK